VAGTPTCAGRKNNSGSFAQNSTPASRDEQRQQSKLCRGERQDQVKGQASAAVTAIRVTKAPAIASGRNTRKVAGLLETSDKAARVRARRTAAMEGREPVAPAFSAFLRAGPQACGQGLKRLWFGK
jgi:hypothetical protein